MFDKLTVGTLDVISPIGGGGALLFPPGFWEPGSFSAYKGHFGTGSTTIPFSGSLVCAPGPTSPLSYNSVGINLLTGVKNLFGVKCNVGSDIKLGALNVEYTALGNHFTGAEFTVTPGDLTVTPADTKNALRGNLNGFWLSNSIPISTEPDKTSDIRLKKDIESYDGGLETILGLRPVRFNWREDKCNDSFLNEFREPETKDGYPGEIKRQYGLIAQEVEEIVPDIVGEREMFDTKYKLIRYSKLVPILISAVQEQQQQIEDLKEEIRLLKENK